MNNASSSSVGSRLADIRVRRTSATCSAGRLDEVMSPASPRRAGSAVAMSSAASHVDPSESGPPALSAENLNGIGTWTPVAGGCPLMHGGNALLVAPVVPVLAPVADEDQHDPQDDGDDREAHRGEQDQQHREHHSSSVQKYSSGLPSASAMRLRFGSLGTMTPRWYSPICWRFIPVRRASSFWLMSRSVIASLILRATM